MSNKNIKPKESLYKDPKRSHNPDLIKDQITSRRTMFNSLEIYGFKAANFIHRFATLSLILFVTGNIVWGLYSYNRYWKLRRQEMRKEQGLE